MRLATALAALMIATPAFGETDPARCDTFEGFEAVNAAFVDDLAAAGTSGAISEDAYTELAVFYVKALNRLAAEEPFKRVCLDLIGARLEGGF